jgi:hypothetical protein
MIVKHYCALGTQPVFRTSEVSNNVVEVKLDESLSNYHPNHQSYVNSMKWSTDPSNKNLTVVDSTIYIDGELRIQQSVINRVN